MGSRSIRLIGMQLTWAFSGTACSSFHCRTHSTGAIRKRRSLQTRAGSYPAAGLIAPRCARAVSGHWAERIQQIGAEEVGSEGLQRRGKCPARHTIVYFSEHRPLAALVRAEIMLCLVRRLKCQRNENHRQNCQMPITSQASKKGFVALSTFGVSVLGCIGKLNCKRANAPSNCHKRNYL